MTPRSFTTLTFLPAAALALVGCPPPPEVATAPVVAPVTATPSPAPAPLAPGGTCPEGMVWFPAAKFQAGGTAADEDTLEGEIPLQSVRINAFCLATRETTAAEYASCYRAGNCTPATPPNYPECTMSAKGREDHPINCVDFNQASTYCEAHGGRLPTEEEWEFAARGMEGRKYPWGNAPPDTTKLNVCDEKCMLLALKIDFMFETSDGFATTAPVGSFPLGRTPEGLLDMAGNVAEWTLGRDCPYSEGRCTAERRVTRGGSWSSGMRAAVTTWGRSLGGRDPAEVSSSVGFRCAAEPL